MKRYKRYAVAETLLRIFVKITGWLPIMLLLLPKVSGRENLPKTRFVLIHNHTTLWDGVLVAMLLVLRRVSFLTSGVLFECPSVCQGFLSMMGCVPLLNGKSTEDVFLELIRKAGEKGCVMISPEGRVSKTGLMPFKKGAAVLAIKNEMPIVPMYMNVRLLSGISKIYIGRPVYPVTPPEDLTPEAAAELTKKLEEEMRALAELYPRTK